MVSLNKEGVVTSSPALSHDAEVASYAWQLTVVTANSYTDVACIAAPPSVKLLPELPALRRTRPAVKYNKQLKHTYSLSTSNSLSLWICQWNI